MSKISLAETPLSIHLNNHRSDVSDANVIPACRHFSQSNHDFNTHAKIHPNLKVKKKGNKPTEVIQDILRKCKNFWIIGQTL